MSSEPTGPIIEVEMVPETDLHLMLPNKDTGRISTPAPLPRSLQKFYQGEPLALGITQILTGLFQISFGILLQEATDRVRFGSPALSMSLPFWSGAMYTVSGSLSVLAATYPKMALVKGGLVINILTALISGVAGIVYLVTIVFHMLAFLLAFALGIFLLFLFLSMLQFCVSISISAFGCKSLRQKDTVEEPAVLYQLEVPGMDKADIGLTSAL